jgi:hypothetical protein
LVVERGSKLQPPSEWVSSVTVTVVPWPH